VGLKMVHQLRKKRPKTGKIEYWIESVPNRYGFGRDYTLILAEVTPDRKLLSEKRFWLGQDAKVFSRMLGMDTRYAVEHYTKKARSRNFDKIQKHIARDVLRVMLGRTERNWNKGLTQKELRGLMGGVKAWEMAVE